MIIVDSREPAKMVEKLRELGVEVERKAIVCDYIVSGHKGIMLVERKSVFDFWNSLKDGRIWDEVGRIAQVEDKRVKAMVLVEGSWSGLIKYLATKNKRLGVPKLRTERNTIGPIYATMVSIVVSFGVSIIHSPSSTLTPYILASMDRWMGKSEKPSTPIFKPKAVSIEEIQERVLSGFPNISRVRARNLLLYFKTLDNALKNVDEWVKVEDIGEKTVEKVKEVLYHVYEEAKGDKTSSLEMGGGTGDKEGVDVEG